MKIFRRLCPCPEASYASANSVPIYTGSFTTPALSLPIPSAGTYLLFAKVLVASTAASATNARIDAKLSIGGGGGDLDNSGATLQPAAGSYATIVLNSAWNFSAAGSVDLFLLTFFNTPAEAGNIKMSALKVAKLTSGILP
jgi:hypothetical protein